MVQFMSAHGAILLQNPRKTTEINRAHYIEYKKAPQQVLFADCPINVIRICRPPPELPDRTYECSIHHLG
jgi:hypothetical protein